MGEAWAHSKCGAHGQPVILVPPSITAEENTVLYEMRIYHAMPGRLPDLNNRFATITLKMWEKHGISQVGFWITAVGPDNNALYYMLEWESMADRERKWNTFATDPAWLGARAETEKNGPLVQRIENMFLTPTAYSKMK